MAIMDQDWSDFARDEFQEENYEDVELKDHKWVMAIEGGAQLMMFENADCVSEWKGDEGSTAFDYTKIFRAYHEGEICLAERDTAIKSWLASAKRYRHNVGDDNKISLRIRRYFNEAEQLLGRPATVFAAVVVDDSTDI